MIGQFYGVTRYSAGPERLIGWAGQIGVAVFFVVSGFCVRLPMARALAADPNARLDVRRYLHRRARRILPPYWIAIAASIVLSTSAALSHRMPMQPSASASFTKSGMRCLCVPSSVLEYRSP